MSNSPGRPKKYDLPDFEKYLSVFMFNRLTVRQYVRGVVRILARCEGDLTNENINNAINVDPFHNRKFSRAGWNHYVKFVELTSDPQIPTFLPVADSRRGIVKITANIESGVIHMMQSFVKQTNAGIQDMHALTTKDFRLLNLFNGSTQTNFIKLRLRHPDRCIFLNLRDAEDYEDQETLRIAFIQAYNFAYHHKQNVPLFSKLVNGTPCALSPVEIGNHCRGALINVRSETVDPKENRIEIGVVSRLEETMQDAALFQWLNDRVSWELVRHYRDPVLSREESNLYPLRRDSVVSATEDRLGNYLSNDTTPPTT